MRAHEERKPTRQAPTYRPSQCLHTYTARPASVTARKRRAGNASCLMGGATACRRIHVQSQATPEKKQKAYDSRHLTNRRGPEVATRLLGTDMRQNLAVVAYLYRTHARVVLRQLGNPREIPR